MAPKPACNLGRVVYTLQNRRVISVTAWKLKVSDFEVCLENSEFDWSVSQSLPASPAESWDSTRTTDKTATFQILSNESFLISILLDAIKPYVVEKASVRNSSINREPDDFWVRRRQTQVLLNEWMLLVSLKIWSDVPVEPIRVLVRPFLRNITTPQNSVLKRNVIR